MVLAFGLNSRKIETHQQVGHFYDLTRGKVAGKMLSAKLDRIYADMDKDLSAGIAFLVLGRDRS